MNHPLFHQLNRNLNRWLPGGGAGCILHVGVSGGLDSVALLRLLLEVSRVRKFRLQVLHCHHGAHPSADVVDFRDRSFRFVEELCKNHGLSLVSNYPRSLGLPTSESEASLRSLRYKFFSRSLELGAAGENTYLTLAHHLDDALENTLVQMIRGAGPESFLSRNLFLNEAGNEHYSGKILRPLLDISKIELADYLTHLQQDYVADPGNLSSEPLRNWLRNDWLPALEAKRQGSMTALGRSLRLIGEWAADNAYHQAVAENGLARPWFREQSHAVKTKALRAFLKARASKVFSLKQIEEVVKRLDSERNDIKFTLAGCHWEASRDWIKVSAPVVPYR